MKMEHDVKYALGLVQLVLALICFVSAGSLIYGLAGGLIAAGITLAIYGGATLMSLETSG